MSWLALELGISRQMLYQVLRGKERSQPVEEALSEMCPDLPEWPQQRINTSGAIPLLEFLKR